MTLTWECFTGIYLNRIFKENVDVQNGIPGVLSVIYERFREDGRVASVYFSASEFHSQ